MSLTCIMGSENPYNRILSKSHFFERYHLLAKKEEELSEKRESLNTFDEQELKAMVKLVIRDQKEILCGTEKVVIEESNYYFVQFQENQALKINEAAQTCLAMTTIGQIAEFYASDTWYRGAILSQMNALFVDSLEVLKNAHEVNMSALVILKRLESLQVDIITADIYPDLKTIFVMIFKLYDAHRRSNVSLDLVDIDAPIWNSIISVLNRDPYDGIDPCVPFDVIADGFIKARKQRREFIQAACLSRECALYIVRCQ